MTANISKIRNALNSVGTNTNALNARIIPTITANEIILKNGSLLVNRALAGVIKDRKNPPNLFLRDTFITY